MCENERFECNKSKYFIVVFPGHKSDKSIFAPKDCKRYEHFRWDTENGSPVQMQMRQSQLFYFVHRWRNNDKSREKKSRINQPASTPLVK